MTKNCSVLAACLTLCVFLLLNKSRSAWVSSTFVQAFLWRGTCGYPFCKCMEKPSLLKITPMCDLHLLSNSAGVSSYWSENCVVEKSRFFFQHFVGASDGFLLHQVCLRVKERPGDFKVGSSAVLYWSLGLYFRPLVRRDRVLLSLGVSEQDLENKQRQTAVRSFLFEPQPKPTYLTQWTGEKEDTETDWRWRAPRWSKPLKTSAHKYQLPPLSPPSDPTRSLAIPPSPSPFYPHLPRS